MKKLMQLVSVILVIVLMSSFNIIVRAQNGEWNSGVPRNFVPNFDREYQISSWLAKTSYELDLKAYEDLKKPAYKGELLLAIVRMYQDMLGSSKVISNGYELDKFVDYNTIEPTSPQASSLRVALRLGMLTGEQIDNKWYMNLGNVLTRAQTAKILAAFYKSTDSPITKLKYRNEFRDIDNHWAEEYIVYCYEHDLMKGMGNGFFNPEESVTKEQVIQILLNILNENSSYSLKNVALAINQTFCVTTSYDRINQNGTSLPANKKGITLTRRTYTLYVGEEETITLNHDLSKQVAVQVISPNYAKRVCCEITDKTTTGGRTRVDVLANYEGIAILKCNYLYDNSNYVYIPIYVINKKSNYYIPVGSLNVSRTNIELEIGETYNFSRYVSITPSNATYNDIFYVSENPAVAEVDYLTGKIYGNKKGTTSIYVISEGNEVRVNITVTGSSYDNTNNYYDNITKIELEETEGYFYVGETFDLKDIIDITPSGYGTSTLKYSSSDSDIVSVSRNGILRACEEGDAVIKISSYSGKFVRYYVYVIDEVEITSIKLDYDSDTFNVGDTFDLKDIMSVYPKSSDLSDISYTSSNSKVVSVNSRGILTMKSVGDAIVTIRSNSGIRKKFYVYVTKDSNNDTQIQEPDIPDSISFGFNSITISVGDSYNLLSIYLGNASNVKFTSSDESIVSTNDNIIVANKSGNVVITAKDSYGNKATLNVNVK